MSTYYRIGVQLPVGGMENFTDGCLDNKTLRFRRRMGHGYEREIEGAKIKGAALNNI